MMVVGSGYLSICACCTCKYIDCTYCCSYNKGVYLSFLSCPMPILFLPLTEIYDKQEGSRVMEGWGDKEDDEGLLLTGDNEVQDDFLWQSAQEALKEQLNATYQKLLKLNGVLKRLTLLVRNGSSTRSNPMPRSKNWMEEMI